LASARRFCAARGNRQILRKPWTKWLGQRAKKNLRRVSAAWKNCLLGVSPPAHRPLPEAPNRLPNNDMHVAAGAAAKTFGAAERPRTKKVGNRRKRAA
jgi:hypothetical protein